MSSAMIEVSDLEKTFGETRALDGVSLRVDQGEVVCVIGPSGSGKSTLLRCINFLEEPSHGNVRVNGIKVEGGEKGQEHRKLIHEVRLKTGMVFQEFNLFPHMSVLEN